MDFEKRLRERLYQQELQQIERDFKNRFNQELTPYNFRDVISRIVNAYSIYISNATQEKTREQLYDMFEQALSKDALNQMKKDIVLDEKEKMYIEYNEMKEYGRRRKSSYRSSWKKSLTRKTQRRKDRRHFTSITKCCSKK